MKEDRRNFIKKTGISLAALSASAITRGKSVPSANNAENLVIVNNETGLRLMSIGDHSQVKLFIPGQNDNDDGILLDCPEIISLTDRAGKSDLVYALFNKNYPDYKVKWIKRENQLSYVIDAMPKVKLECKISLDADGIRVSYNITNLTGEHYPRTIVSTCNKLRSAFYDVFLERTYVHHQDGFAQLAEFIPQRIVMPIDQWLPCRIRAAYTIQPPVIQKKRGADGIMLYDSPKKVDISFLATRSADGQWIAASSSVLKPEQVWSNPKLTCHHVDPAISLAANAVSKIEIKLFVFKGSLPDALEKVKAYTS
jgi:hypothetical protein